MLTKIFILAVLALIVISLFRALALLFRKEQEKNQMVRSLTIRVALSITLFLLLMAGFYFGVIPQKGLR